MNQIDLGRALKAFFEDKEWISRTVMGFVWIFLIVTAPAAYGAQVAYIKDVSEGRESLPAWDEFGDKWIRGLVVMVAGFIYFLPVLALGLIVLAPLIVATVREGDSTAFGALFAGGACLFTLFAIVYTILISLLYSAALTNYAMKGTMGAFFEFGEIMGKVRGGTGYFTAWLWALVIAVIGSTVTGVVAATGIGGILSPAVTYFTLMTSGHIWGQWAALAYGKPHVSSGSYPPHYAPPAPPAPPYVPPNL